MSSPRTRGVGGLAARATDIRIQRDLDVVPRSTGPLVAGSAGVCDQGSRRASTWNRYGNGELGTGKPVTRKDSDAALRRAGSAVDGTGRWRPPPRDRPRSGIGRSPSPARGRELTRREMIALLVDAGYPPAWWKGSAPAIPCSVGRPEPVPADPQPNGHARRLRRSHRRDDSTGEDPARRRWPPFGVVRWPDRRAERANDEVIPVEMSRALTGVEYRELSGIGHFGIIDPRTPAYSARHGGRPRGHPR